jgi:hypothetical protein
MAVMWTPAEDALLRSLYGPSNGPAALAASKRFPGRSAESISRRVWMLKLAPVSDPRAWTAEQIAALRECVARGEGMAAMRQATGKSRLAIYSQLGKLGLREAHAGNAPAALPPRPAGPAGPAAPAGPAEEIPPDARLWTDPEVRGCRWVYGDARPWRVCGRPRTEGNRNYCREHADKAAARPAGAGA